MKLFSGGRFGAVKKRVAILGCGPAGLFLAHAFTAKGWSVEVFSKKRPSELYGAQYLHAPIQGLKGEHDPSTVRYLLMGTQEDYQRKVYGSMPVPFVSPGRLSPEHPVWDIRAAYADAWNRYQGLVTDTGKFTEDFVWRLFADSDFTLIYNTVPLPSICRNPSHRFVDQKVWAMGDAPERGRYAPFSTEPFTVVCNGTPDQAWYRSSNIYGYSTVEWPEDRKPPIPGVAEVSKPIAHNCDCWSIYPKFRTAGRYGSWDKAELSHMAYQRVMEEVK